MPSDNAFDQRVAACWERISPKERSVARFFQQHRDEVLVGSAAALAARAGTSDATVIRTARALGFAGMAELRRALALELRQGLSPAARLTRTLGEAGDHLGRAFEVTLEIHREALEGLRRDITPELFRTAIRTILEARRRWVFGIGPSSAMADYLTIQLGRFGLETRSLTQAGLLLADGLQQLRAGDLVIIFAYTRVYRELAVLLDQAWRSDAGTMLVSDTLGPRLGDRVGLVLPVARGRADLFSMHTATLGLIEALLVGIASERPAATLASLDCLNALRAELAGVPMDLPGGELKAPRRASAGAGRPKDPSHGA